MKLIWFRCVVVVRSSFRCLSCVTRVVRHGVGAHFTNSTWMFYFRLFGCVVVVAFADTILSLLFSFVFKIKSTILPNIKCTRTLVLSRIHTIVFSRCWFIELLECCCFGNRHCIVCVCRIYIEFHSCLKNKFIWKKIPAPHFSLWLSQLSEYIYVVVPFTALIMNMQNSRCSDDHECNIRLMSVCEYVCAI